MKMHFSHGLQSPRQLNNGNTLYSYTLGKHEQGYAFPTQAPMVDAAKTSERFGTRNTEIIGRLILGAHNESTPLYLMRQRIADDLSCLIIADSVYDGRSENGVYLDRAAYAHALAVGEKDTVRIGRQSEDSRMLDFAAGVSRQHVAVTSVMNEGAVILDNLNPTNHTTIQFAVPPR